MVLQSTSHPVILATRPVLYAEIRLHKLNPILSWPTLVSDPQQERLEQHQALCCCDTIEDPRCGAWDVPPHPNEKVRKEFENSNNVFLDPPPRNMQGHEQWLVRLTLVVMPASKPRHKTRQELPNLTWWPLWKTKILCNPIVESGCFNALYY